MTRHLFFAVVVFLLAVSCLGPLNPYDWPPEETTTSDDTSTTVPTTEGGLVAYWSCDDSSGSTLHDSVNGLDFSLSGTSFDEGKIGGAVRFDGKNSYAVLFQSDAKALQFGTGDFSISLLVQPLFYQDIADSMRFDIVSKGLIKEKGYTIAIAAKSFTALVGHSKNDQRDTTFDASRKDWYHIVLVRRNSMVELWVNTKKILSYTNDEDISAADSKLILGNNAEYESNNGFPGSIDEVRMFNRALDSNKIKALYSAYFN